MGPFCILLKSRSNSGDTEGGGEKRRDQTDITIIGWKRQPETEYKRQSETIEDGRHSRRENITEDITDSKRGESI